MFCLSQFTYINLSFAPSLDDSVANLYKVRGPVRISFLDDQFLMQNNAVFCDGWPPNSQL